MIRSSSVIDPIGRATDIVGIPGVLVAFRKCKPSHHGMASSEAGSVGVRPSSSTLTLGDNDLWVFPWHLTRGFSPRLLESSVPDSSASVARFFDCTRGPSSSLIRCTTRMRRRQTSESGLTSTRQRLCFRKTLEKPPPSFPL